MTMRSEAAAEARWPELRYPVGAFFAIRAAAFLRLGVLAARKLVTGRPAAAARALRILRGLVAGLARPEWEPPHRSVWRAVPTVTRTPDRPAVQRARAGMR
ncbi:hypothetical protein [Frankia sp. Mgl5]|uniref:hypothetical protein n=1 Tax=Frankia sp. Mgl5 TaxID=2933793 RepID=UPI0027E52BB9|nr:hypothetical protein [Frankia sp. Mgl5]